ncbi:MAG: DUF1835 domain-containing protein [Aureibaculum sp.]|nr:DUF1835 domain-containing protein [Aureibaculum sp.]
MLNGDSLKQQFPENIQGDIIVARECLVDGHVKGKDSDELFASRAKFLSQNYGGTEQDYYEKVVPEFQKIKSINDDSDINLWFEDDLFCQVNFWFVVHLLNKKIRNNTVFLIRPESHNQYGFGGLNNAELISIYKNRSALMELNKVASLWESYQNDNTVKLISTARELESVYPFILGASEAHVERKPTNENAGRPIQSLITIMKELETEEFAPVFREFNKRESIYGFGDLQVKRLFDEIINNS